MRHLELDLSVSFGERVLRGTATLSLEPAGATLVLDTRDLKIFKVNGSETGFTLGPRDPILGAPLTITLPPGARSVTIEYETSPSASGLQWLDAAQTAGKRSPFLYSQSQAIHARSWAPLQDTPSVRFTFSARISAPAPLTSLMAAARLKDGHFHMPTPIPSYLLALAVGELEFRPVGARCGIWAEPPVVEKAAREFEDVEKMVQAAERLYGPYLWGRYDILVLPPSFPFGGMENPRLTFATPTVIAGDKSLVALVSHELAHSWSGNLVTNANWSDLWLNEGFTTYFERRIQEEIYGRARSEMEFSLEVGELQDEMKTLKPDDTRLVTDFTGRDPDDALSQVPYVKGALMLRMLEEKYGRTRFDAFLRGYFQRYAFQSITHDQFLAELERAFPGEDVSDWLNSPGLPSRAPRVSYDFESTPKRSWSTQEWLHYLRQFPPDLPAAKLAELDRQWDLTSTGNAEIAAQWLRMAIRARYEIAYSRLERFLIEVGRRKFAKPLYEELAKTPEGRQRARAIYGKARPGYHPITQSTVDAILK
ncbi:MAG TPA: M1 family metallopeptidase [Bryobacteraceae bacterium]|nr:M1 family metallopeptidase [Bryobacteraceae bacterium]